MGMMINRRRAYGGKKILLPSGYTQLEYIESTGTQWIDTGYKAERNYCKVVGKISFTSFSKQPNNSYNFIIPFGAYNQRCPVNIYVPVSQNNSVNIGVEAGTTYGTSISAGMIYLNTPFSFDLEAKNNKLNGFCNNVSYTNRQYNGVLSDVDTLALFCSKHLGVTYVFTMLRVYEISFYDTNGVVRNFIPCINPQNKVGMYDLVSQQFFGNSGAGSFIAGPDV